MAVGLPAMGILSYNGVLFDGTSQVTVDVQNTFDEADRAAYAQRQIITVRAIVAAASYLGPTNRPPSQIGTSDFSMETLRKLLMEPRQEFVMIGRGFGNDLVVNPINPTLHASFYNDVSFGPKPRLLHFEPIGGSNCCEIEWQVEVNISFCTPSTPPIMALNYTASYSIDDEGLTTRVISGYYLIAQTTVASGITYSADQFRAAIAPSLPVAGPQELKYKIKDQGSAAEEEVTWVWQGMGFRRMQQWEVSADKSREDFTIVDRQIPSNYPLPDYVVSARGRHAGAFKRPRRGSGSMNTHRISIELKAAEGISPALMFFTFASIVNSRLAFANRDENGAVKKRVLIDGLQISEGLFGDRITSFELEYRVLAGAKTLANFVKLSGFWQPLGTAWQSWAASMATVYTQYGPSGMKNTAANDAIHTLCGGNSPSNAANVNVNLPAQPTLTRIWPKMEKPDPGYSYRDYQCRVHVETQRPVARQSILQVPSPDDATQYNGTQMNEAVKFEAAIGPGTPDIIQQGGGPRHTALIMGYAERVGYEVPRIAFDTIGSAAGAVASLEHYDAWEVASVDGIPVYRAEWIVRYALPTSPAATKPPANYEQGLGPGGNPLS